MRRKSAKCRSVPVHLNTVPLGHLQMVRASGSSLKSYDQRSNTSAPAHCNVKVPEASPISKGRLPLAPPPPKGPNTERYGGLGPLVAALAHEAGSRGGGGGAQAWPCHSPIVLPPLVARIRCRARSVLGATVVLAVYRYLLRCVETPGLLVMVPLVAGELRHNLMPIGHSCHSGSKPPATPLAGPVAAPA